MVPKVQVSIRGEAEQGAKRAQSSQAKILKRQLSPFQRKLVFKAGCDLDRVRGKLAMSSKKMNLIKICQ